LEANDEVTHSGKKKPGSVCIAPRDFRRAFTDERSPAAVEQLPPIDDRRTTMAAE